MDKRHILTTQGGGSEAKEWKGPQNSTTFFGGSQNSTTPSEGRITKINTYSEGGSQNFAGKFS